MLFVRSLSPEEEKELCQRMKSAKRTRIFVRLKTVELSRQGKTVQEISELLSRHPNSIRSYLHKFNAGGFPALMPIWGGGARQKLKEFGNAYWEDLLNRPPSHFERIGSQAQTWNYELLAAYLLQYEQIPLHPSTIWLHLRRISYTAGRSKLSVTSPDPDYQVKREREETLEKKALKVP